MGSVCELMDHIRIQMPYAISAGATALLLGTLPAGFGAVVDPASHWYCTSRWR